MLLLTTVLKAHAVQMHLVSIFLISTELMLLQTHSNATVTLVTLLTALLHKRVMSAKVLTVLTLTKKLTVAALAQPTVYAKTLRDLTFAIV